MRQRRRRAGRHLGVGLQQRQDPVQRVVQQRHRRASRRRRVRPRRRRDQLGHAVQLLARQRRRRLPARAVRTTPSRSPATSSATTSARTTAARTATAASTPSGRSTTPTVYNNTIFMTPGGEGPAQHAANVAPAAVRFRDGTMKEIDFYNNLFIIKDNDGNPALFNPADAQRSAAPTSRPSSTTTTGSGTAPRSPIRPIPTA